MYRAAAVLDPESIERISRVAFRELRRAGVRTVGEFHYVHHQPDGTPYDDRTVMSDAVIRAAKHEGLRVSLLRVAYHRAGPGRPAEAGQRRFCDASVDDVLRDVDALRAKYRMTPTCASASLLTRCAPCLPSGLPSSGRTPRDTRSRSTCTWPSSRARSRVRRGDGQAAGRAPRRPRRALRVVRRGSRHAPLRDEAELLGRARAFACVCATTEADLGDGLPDLGALRAAGARLCAGIDSHVITDPLADLRALETLERLRAGQRVTFAPAGRTPAEELWHAGSLAGAQACGFSDAGGSGLDPREHPTLDLVEDELLLDAIVFSGGSTMFAGS